jgi:hypothetical protein
MSPVRLRFSSPNQPWTWQGLSQPSRKCRVDRLQSSLHVLRLSRAHFEVPGHGDDHFMDVIFLEWGKEYGPHFTLSIPLLGRVIVISDPKLFKSE